MSECFNELDNEAKVASAEARRVDSVILSLDAVRLQAARDAEKARWDAWFSKIDKRVEPCRAFTIWM